MSDIVFDEEAFARMGRPILEAGGSVEPEREHFSGHPTCYACGREIDSLRVTWAHRDGALRSMHRTCVRPTPRVHGVVVR